MPTQGRPVCRSGLLPFRLRDPGPGLAVPRHASPREEIGWDRVASSTGSDPGATSVGRGDRRVQGRGRQPRPTGRRMAEMAAPCRAYWPRSCGLSSAPAARRRRGGTPPAHEAALCSDLGARPSTPPTPSRPRPCAGPARRGFRARSTVWSSGTVRDLGRPGPDRARGAPGRLTGSPARQRPKSGRSRWRTGVDVGVGLGLRQGHGGHRPGQGGARRRQGRPAGGRAPVYGLGLSVGKISARLGLSRTGWGNARGQGRRLAGGRVPGRRPASPGTRPRSFWGPPAG